MEIREGIEETSTACTGTAAKPTAVAGNLCVYFGTATSPEIEFGVFHKVSAAALGADTAGTSYTVANPDAGTLHIYFGTWAVTAP